MKKAVLSILLVITLLSGCWAEPSDTALGYQFVSNDTIWIMYIGSAMAWGYDLKMNNDTFDIRIKKTSLLFGEPFPRLHIPTEAKYVRLIDI